MSGISKKEIAQRMVEVGCSVEQISKVIELRVEARQGNMWLKTWTGNLVRVLDFTKERQFSKNANLITNSAARELVEK